jgi:hypothetical protein
VIVDPDAVLALAIALQRLESVSRQYGKVLKYMGRLDAIELEAGGPFNSRECL